ncbi:MAG TPA: hypothetical protein VGD78_07385 [Chthoniobacterales bacterium]
MQPKAPDSGKIIDFEQARARLEKKDLPGADLPRRSIPSLPRAGPDAFADALPAAVLLLGLIIYLCLSIFH